MATGRFDADAAPKPTDSDQSDVKLLRANFGFDK